MNGSQARFGSTFPHRSAPSMGEGLSSLDMQMPDALKHLFEIMLVLALCFLIIGYNTGIQASEQEGTPDAEEGGYYGETPEGLEPIEEELEEVERGAGTSSSYYAEVGTVYVDRATGQYYVVGNDQGGE